MSIKSKMRPQKEIKDAMQGTEDREQVCLVDAEQLLSRSPTTPTTAHAFIFFYFYEYNCCYHGLHL